VNHSFCKGCDTNIYNLIVNANDDCLILADRSFWIPFTNNSCKTEFELEILQAHLNHGVIEFNAAPTIFHVKLALLKILLSTNTIESISNLRNLCYSGDSTDLKNKFVQTTELICFLKTVLRDCSDREDISKSVFDQGYHQTISKIDIIAEILLHEIAETPYCHPEIPKWKGRSTQFIELISIGIELNLFDGANQNEICNSLLKAFQVDAESDQPIYKQRFNALFKRSKVQLPLIADYIRKVEEAKKNENQS
jgi:hypothetical protein